ncbi:MAG: hypothetical protein GY749_16830 [Desulfobacteraceae bacterium]|nr:hypothetical protein [Desulfobacteraceae bacterium]
MEKKRIDLKEALNNNEDFMTFLEQEAISDEHQRLKKNIEKGPHPTGEMLYDYVLGWMDHKKSRVIRDHISLCSPCTSEVLRIRLIEEELEEELLDWVDKLSVLERLKKFVFAPGSLQKYILPGVGIVATCLLFFLWQTSIQTPDLADLITESYKTALTHKVTLTHDNLKENLNFPWEGPSETFGFGFSNRYFHANRAFGAGLWSGRQELSEEKEPMPEFLSPAWHSDENIKKDNWSVTRWTAYFSLGKWCFLARYVCHSGEEFPYTFWEKQGIILNQIQKNFSEMPEEKKENVKLIDITLENIKKALKASEENAPSKKQCKTIGYEAGNLIKYMSPQHIPED